MGNCYHAIVEVIVRDGTNPGKAPSTAPLKPYMSASTIPQKADLPPPITGLEVVGRGIYIQPRRPYELKDILFQRQDHRIIHSRETQQGYAIPSGYEVNDSPPMPPNQSLNQTLIEESWERFDKQFSLDASVAAGNGLFTVDASMSQSSQSSAQEECYYALRSSFIPLWTVYLASAAHFSDRHFELDVPTPFRHRHRRAYERFFERYGTHYVKRAWVGGKASLVFSVRKAADMDRAEIQAGITASLATGQGASNNSRLQESKAKLQNNAECTVFGKGGDELRLAALSSLDETAYNDWLGTVKDNPQVIEMEVAGIWTLIDDEATAQALQDAYKAANAFEPISAVFRLGKRINFFRDDRFFVYDMESEESQIPAPVVERWPVLAEINFEQIDAAFEGSGLRTADGEDLGGKLFLFRTDHYIRLSIDSGQVDPGYPRLISEGWPGLHFERIDAALNVGSDTVYFFKGAQYSRFNLCNNQVDPGYPDLINRRWAGVIFDRINAAIYWKDGKVYFFKDDQYVRYDMTVYQADPGYPRFIVGSYVQDWKFFG